MLYDLASKVSNEGKFYMFQYNEHLKMKAYKYQKLRKKWYTNLHTNIQILYVKTFFYILVKFIAFKTPLISPEKILGA